MVCSTYMCRISLVAHLPALPTCAASLWSRTTFGGGAAAAVSPSSSACRGHEPLALDWACSPRIVAISITAWAVGSELQHSLCPLAASTEHGEGASAD